MPKSHIDAPTLQAPERELTQEIEGMREETLRTYERRLASSNRLLCVRRFYRLTFC